ncbi:MAG: hypothetical protein AB7S41_00320 [Parvibaculaceae bacterium]
MPSTPASDLARLLDLDRYPIHDPASRTELVEEGRRQLEAESCVVLPGFLAPGVADAMSEEAMRTVPQAYRRDRQYTAYTRAGGTDLPDSHPTRRFFWNRQHIVPTDILPASGLILSLYGRDELTRLVADILGEPALHRVADPLMSCNVTVLGEGDEHGWHFDGNDFVVSLLLQAPEQGGAFEFAPYIREEGNENYDAVAAAMDGKPGLVRQKSVTPGTLMIFCGRRALHRVSPVSGRRPRLIALFSYDRQPDMVWGPEARLRAVGRTEARAA